jgi:hypothetical protein
MRRFLRRRRPMTPAAVGFCERCGVVCSARCRADRVREQARTSAFAFQVGLR